MSQRKQGGPGNTVTKMEFPSRAWWHTPAIPALERLTQVYCHEVEVSIGYRVSLSHSEDSVLANNACYKWLACNSHTGTLE